MTAGGGLRIVAAAQEPATAARARARLRSDAVALRTPMDLRETQAHLVQAALAVELGDARGARALRPHSRSRASTASRRASRRSERVAAEIADGAVRDGSVAEPGRAAWGGHAVTPRTRDRLALALARFTRAACAARAASRSRSRARSRGVPRARARARSAPPSRRRAGSRSTPSVLTRARRRVDRAVAHAPVRTDHEHRRARRSRPSRSGCRGPRRGRPARDASERIGNGSPSSVRSASERGARIDRERDDVRAERADLVVHARVLRQLAETERSPVAAEEDQDERARGDERRRGCAAPRSNRASVKSGAREPTSGVTARSLREELRQQLRDPIRLFLRPPSACRCRARRASPSSQQLRGSRASCRRG